VPVVIFSEMIGYTRFQPLNTILAMFGFFSLFVAAFNLIPAPPLDGAVAWGLVPALFRRYLRTRTAKREHDWRP
jgi:Zn-dependent protease